MSDFALMTVADVAKATHLQPWRIYELVAAGELNPQRVGKRLYFTRAALRKWLGIEQSAVTPTSSN